MGEVDNKNANSNGSEWKTTEDHEGMMDFRSIVIVESRPVGGVKQTIVRGIRASQKAGRSTGGSMAGREGGRSQGRIGQNRSVYDCPRCLEVLCLVDARRQSLCP
jgi:hypothetical protein